MPARASRTPASSASLLSLAKLRKGAASSTPVPPTKRVEGVVFALIPEYRVVKIRTANGHQYDITEQASGIPCYQLLLGQRVRCLVAPDGPHVLKVLKVLVG